MFWTNRCVKLANFQQFFNFLKLFHVTSPTILVSGTTLATTDFTFKKPSDNLVRCLSKDFSITYPSTSRQDLVSPSIVGNSRQPITTRHTEDPTSTLLDLSLKKISHSTAVGLSSSLPLDLLLKLLEVLLLPLISELFWKDTTTFTKITQTRTARNIDCFWFGLPIVFSASNVNSAASFVTKSVVFFLHTQRKF